MLSIICDAKRVARSVRVKLVEEKTSYFTGSELVIGVGPRKDLTRRKWILVARQVIMLAKQHQLKAISVNAGDFDLDGEQLASNFEMANYEFDRYKTKKEGTILETIYLENAD